jgi:glutamyl-tRNA synthetase
MSATVRVRFAPSPTGPLHVGSARTALFNWLFARHEGGQFLLRIEDTDRVRSKPEYLDQITEALRWLGLTWDGEVVFQSQRFEIYRQKAEALLQSGLAYREGRAILLKISAGEIVAFEDLLHGQIKVNTLEIKDQVLLKSDGTPTYSFACVVDDAEMGITHVIRGDDHISNTPKQVLIHRALGLPLPIYVHIPLILGQDRSRLSKRHGATDLNAYRAMGILPQAMVNFLALLGWSPGDNLEILPVEELIRRFDIKRIGRTGSVFDMKKLLWMNSQYMKQATLETLLPLVHAKLREHGLWQPGLDPVWLGQVIELYKTRADTVEDLCRQAQALFLEEVPMDPDAVQARLKHPAVPDRLKAFADRLEQLPTWNASSIEEACRTLASELGVPAAELIHPTRVAVTGRSVGPSLFHVLEVAGRDRVVYRLRRASRYN